MGLSRRPDATMGTVRLGSLGIGSAMAYRGPDLAVHVVAMWSVGLGISRGDTGGAPGAILLVDGRLEFG